MLSRVREQLGSQGIGFDVTQDAKDHIIKLGYDVAYGARPLRRVIQNMVEDPLSEQLLVGSFKSGDTVVVDKSEDAGLSIVKAAEKTPVEAR
jgi:ATP-dependent Clp protease ATP-binding subunit ClpC